MTFIESKLFLWEPNILKTQTSQHKYLGQLFRVWSQNQKKEKSTDFNNKNNTIKNMFPERQYF